jgi:hypothetical protein
MVEKDPEEDPQVKCPNWHRRFAMLFSEPDPEQKSFE